MVDGQAGPAWVVHGLGAQDFGIGITWTWGLGWIWMRYGDVISGGLPHVSWKIFVLGFGGVSL